MKISHSFEFNCLPEALYKAISEPIAATQWWTDDCVFDPQASAIATFWWRKFGWSVQMLIKKTIPNSLIEWECVGSNMQNTDAWVGSTITFQIVRTTENNSILNFIHGGYKNSPCYDECNAGWAFVLGSSLKSYIETGIGQPFRNIATTEK